MTLTHLLLKLFVGSMLEFLLFLSLFAQSSKISFLPSFRRSAGRPAGRSDGRSVGRSVGRSFVRSFVRSFIGLARFSCTAYVIQPSTKLDWPLETLSSQQAHSGDASAGIVSCTKAFQVGPKLATDQSNRVLE